MVGRRDTVRGCGKREQAIKQLTHTGNQGASGKPVFYFARDHRKGDQESEETKSLFFVFETFGAPNFALRIINKIIEKTPPSDDLVKINRIKANS